jgi:hypothetical protein
MRSLCCDSLAVFAIMVGVAIPCLAQAPPGPATLETLANSPEAQSAQAAPETADSGAMRPAGTVARPKDGVQHPDLDKAWAEYDADVTDAAERIRAAISKQFNAATDKGDLDAAEKWQAASEKFAKAGEVPSGLEVKAAVDAAVADLKRAKTELSKAYKSVWTALTMEKKIAEAMVARTEWDSLQPAKAPLPDDSLRPVLGLRFKKWVTSPAGERSTEHEIVEFEDKGVLFWNGKQSPNTWTQVGPRTLRFHLGDPRGEYHGVAELTLQDDGSLMGQNTERRDGAVFKWELVPQ